jgi:hypothetical protein
MVNGRSLDPPGPRRCGKQQKGHAIGTAGYGYSQRCLVRDQRVEVGGKAVDEGRIDVQVISVIASRREPTAMDCRVPALLAMTV